MAPPSAEPGITRRRDFGPAGNTLSASALLLIDELHISMLIRYGTYSN
jgi:hypothetical protein